MTKIRYVKKNFRRKSMEKIVKANEIIAEYAADGYSLTLRQLYYQFVARDLIPNTQKEYSNLGAVINNARLSGLLDWEAIEDRTRNLAELPNWEDAESIVDSCASQFRLDKWSDQPYRVEVWVEKEALAGVFARVCDDLQVPYFSCRGYVSQSEMWRAAQRLRDHERNKQLTTIFHFGDHDPSGIDMTRDIKERLRLFGSYVVVKRLGLNMDQVDRYGPPPNPAKLSDSRAAEYVHEYGDESWELDALPPQILSDLVRDAVNGVRDDKLWKKQVRQEEEAKKYLRGIADNWSGVTGWVRRNT